MLITIKPNFQALALIFLLINIGLAHTKIYLSTWDEKLIRKITFFRELDASITGAICNRISKSVICSGNQQIGNLTYFLDSWTRRRQRESWNFSKLPDGFLEKLGLKFVFEPNASVDCSCENAWLFLPKKLLKIHLKLDHKLPRFCTNCLSASFVLDLPKVSGATGCGIDDFNECFSAAEIEVIRTPDSVTCRKKVDNSSDCILASFQSYFDKAESAGLRLSHDNKECPNSVSINLTENFTVENSGWMICKFEYGQVPITHLIDVSTYDGPPYFALFETGIKNNDFYVFMEIAGNLIIQSNTSFLEWFYRYRASRVEEWKIQPNEPGVPGAEVAFFVEEPGNLGEDFRQGWSVLRVQARFKNPDTTCDQGFYRVVACNERQECAEKGFQVPSNYVYIAAGPAITVLVFLILLVAILIKMRIIKNRKSAIRIVVHRPSGQKSDDSELQCLNSSSRPPSSLVMNQNPNYYLDWIGCLKLETNVPIVEGDEIETVKSLGEGAFGKVYLVRRILPRSASTHMYLNSETGNDPRPRLSTCPSPMTCRGKIKGTKGGQQQLAMKQLKYITIQKLEDLAREASVLAKLDHQNIVKFYGLTLKKAAGSRDCLTSFENLSPLSGSQPSVVIGLLFEYMELGDLVNYLRQHNPEVTSGVERLDFKDLLAISAQIASGLQYLSEEHLVHRDLAARNCLVGADLTVKLSDFGMTRDIYVTDYYKMDSNTMVPLRWLPPESIIYRKFTTESDVWSLGVLFWEVFSYGQVPWYLYSNSEVLDIVKEGQLLSQPQTCPEIVYEDLILKCWSLKPEERITAKKAREILHSFLESSVDYCPVISSGGASREDSFQDLNQVVDHSK